MMSARHTIKTTDKGERFVRAPRATDALGHALRGAFPGVTLPADMEDLLHRIDRVTH